MIQSQTSRDVMAPLKIDYTKAVVYKIVCRDPLVTEKYVGSTTNLIKRRSGHKTLCNSPKSKDYNYFVYQFIRDHGGFDNFEVVPVEYVSDCLNGDMLRARERFWFESLHAELNKYVPSRTIKQWREDNREHNLNKKKEWYKLNRELNREELNERRRELRALKKTNTLGSMTQILT